MSGGMFPLADGLDGDGGEGEWNPLLCFLCHQTYREPCLLACYHSFCAPCLKGRSIDGKLSCPICGYVSLQHLPRVRDISLQEGDLPQRRTLHASNRLAPSLPRGVFL